MVVNDALASPGLGFLPAIGIGVAPTSKQCPEDSNSSAAEGCLLFRGVPWSLNPSREETRDAALPREGIRFC